MTGATLVSDRASDVVLSDRLIEGVLSDVRLLRRKLNWKRFLGSGGCAGCCCWVGPGGEAEQVAERMVELVLEARGGS